MSDLNKSMIARYRTNFLQEVEANVEEGEWVKMCMQCGVCAGSCPLGEHWQHLPQQLFMMIRAGKREAVLSSESMWMCTTCYSCVDRCPRGIPVTHIMHGLAHYAKRLGLSPKSQPTEAFSQIFWDNLMKQGRINEPKMALSLYFKDGFSSGIKNLLTQRKLGQNMMKAKRMSAMAMLGGHGIQDTAGLQRIITKAQEIENAKLKNTDEPGESSE